MPSETSSLENVVQVFGLEPAGLGEADVHSIELWFSQRRNAWVVERLNSAGDIIGPVHHCADAEDAQACLQDWLRAHAEAHSFFRGEPAPLPAKRVRKAA